MSDIDAEDLIARLSSGLNPADRAAFRRAAENALATSPECSREGSAYRCNHKALALLRPPAGGHRRLWLGVREEAAEQSSSATKARTNAPGGKPENQAEFFLQQFGYEVYLPKVR